jgi:hypothetical protein
MIAETTLEFFLDKIRSREAFAFSRWGDGEWKSVLGQHKPGKHNCDGHRFFPPMGKSLALKLLRPEINKFLQQHGLQELTWYDADVFHDASIKGKLEQVLAPLQERTVIVVGPDHLKRLKPVHIPYAQFIDVPPRNAYLSKTRIVRDIRAALEKHRHALISLSAGMPTELIIDELWPLARQHGHTLIDFGSLWDPLAGVQSRSYHKHLKLE